jgi:hypothetical protein
MDRRRRLSRFRFVSTSSSSGGSAQLAEFKRAPSSRWSPVTRLRCGRAGGCCIGRRCRINPRRADDDRAGRCDVRGGESRESGCRSGFRVSKAFGAPTATGASAAPHPGYANCGRSGSRVAGGEHRRRSSDPPNVVGRFAEHVLPGVAAGGLALVRFRVQLTDLLSVKVTYVDAGDRSYTTDARRDQRLKAFAYITVEEGDSVRVPVTIMVETSRGPAPDGTDESGE